MRAIFQLTIVALRPTAREAHLVAVAVQQGGHMGAGRLHCQLARPTKHVIAGWISKIFAKVRLHGSGGRSEMMV